MNKKSMFWILPIILLLSIVGASATVTYRVPASVSTNSGNVNVTVYPGNGTSAQDIMGANISLRYLNNTAQWVNNTRNYTTGMDQISLTLPSASYNDGTWDLIVQVELQNTTKDNTSSLTIYSDNTDPTITYTTAPEDKTDQSSTSSTIAISSTEELTSAYIDFGAGRTQTISNLTGMKTTYSGTITDIPRGTYTWRVIGFEAGTSTQFSTANREITISDKTGVVLDEQGQVVQPGVSTPTGMNGGVIAIVIFVLLIILSQWNKK